MDLMPRKIIIFDYDGVIADTLMIKSDAFISTFGDVALVEHDKYYISKYHFKNGGVSRDKKILHFMKHFGIPYSDREFSDRLNKFKSELLNNLLFAKEIDGAWNYIDKIWRKGFIIYIASAAPEEELKYILKKQTKINIFESIFGFPNKKSKSIKDIMQRHPKSSAIFFGDSIQDINAVRESGFERRIEFIGINPSEKLMIELKRTNKHYYTNFCEIDNE